MKAENISFLNQHETVWITLRDAQYMRGVSGAVRSEFQRIMQEEFSPGYMADLWCPACVCDMVTMLYTRFEAWKAAQPVKVKAGFPSNKKM